MQTQQAQIKINLSLKLKGFLESRAQQFGLPVASFVKHLIIQEVKDMEYPVFQASERTEKAVKKAMEEIDKAVDADTFFSKLHK